MTMGVVKTLVVFALLLDATAAAPSSVKADLLRAEHEELLASIGDNFAFEEDEFGTTGGDGGESKAPAAPSPAGPAASNGGSGAQADFMRDVDKYGTCLKDYRFLTLKENCGFAADRPGGVTLQFAKCVASEMATLNMAYKPGEARKQFIHHGVGGDADQTQPSSQVRHVTQKCKAAMAYACASDTSDASAKDSPERTACRGGSVSAAEVPASIGQDSQCPAKVLKMQARAADEDDLYDALDSRAQDVAWAFRDVPDSSFEGGSKVWGAAVAVCHEISQVGAGGAHAGATLLPDSAYATNGMYGQPPGPVPRALEGTPDVMYKADPEEVRKKDGQCKMYCSNARNQFMFKFDDEDKDEPTYEPVPEHVQDESLLITSPFAIKEYYEQPTKDQEGDLQGGWTDEGIKAVEKGVTKVKTECIKCCGDHFFNWAKHLDTSPTKEIVLDVNQYSADLCALKHFGATDNFEDSKLKKALGLQPYGGYKGPPKPKLVKQKVMRVYKKEKKGKKIQKSMDEVL